MKVTNLQYFDEFTFSEKEDHLEISGIAFRSGKIDNKKVFIDESELNPIAKSMHDIPLIDSHNKDSVKSVLGKVIKAWVDGIYIKYIAHVMDAQVIDLIKKKLIKGVSVGLQFEKSEELKDGFLKLIGLVCRELSLVNFPAIEEASINYGEFSLEIEPDLVADLEPDDLTLRAYQELKKKYDHALNMIGDYDSEIKKLRKENKKLSKQYEYLLVTGEILEDKYVDFDEELILLIAELRNEMKNYTNVQGNVADEDLNNTTTLESAKEDLRRLIFDTSPKKELKSWDDFRKKYGDLGDHL